MTKNLVLSEIFSLWNKLPELLFEITLFKSKFLGIAEEYKNINTFVITCRQHYDVFQKKNGNENIIKFVQPRKMALSILQNQNIDVVINDTDKNFGPACTDKHTSELPPRDVHGKWFSY